VKNEEDPFLLSGCQVTGGSGCMLVLAVGKESRWGRIRVRLLGVVLPCMHAGTDGYHGTRNMTGQAGAGDEGDAAAGEAR
jgi:hypothetical protein